MSKNKYQIICTYVFNKRDYFCRYNLNKDGSELVLYIDATLDTIKPEYSEIIKDVFIYKNRNWKEKYYYSESTNYRRYKRAMEEFVNCLNNQIML